MLCIIRKLAQSLKTLYHISLIFPKQFRNTQLKSFGQRSRARVISTRTCRRVLCFELPLIISWSEFERFGFCPLRGAKIASIYSSVILGEIRFFLILTSPFSDCSDALCRFSAFLDIFRWMPCSYVLPFLGVLVLWEKKNLQERNTWN